MSRALLTYADGPEHESFAEITREPMCAYARRHGYDFPKLSPFDFFDRERPASWWKCEAILRAFIEGHREVLWLDADVMIVNGERDIFPELDSSLGVVVHDQHPHGLIPNAGVLAVARKAWPAILKMSRLDRFGASRHVWEQAGLASILGYDHDHYPMEPMQESEISWTNLPYEWNVSPWDRRGRPKLTRFFHACGVKDAAERRKMLEEAMR